MMCDGCYNFVFEDEALYVTYDIDCCYMQQAFHNEDCRRLFEIREGLTEEEIATRNDA